MFARDPSSATLYIKSATVHGHHGVHAYPLPDLACESDVIARLQWPEYSGLKVRHLAHIEEPGTPVLVVWRVHYRARREGLCRGNIVVSIRFRCTKQR